MTDTPTALSSALSPHVHGPAPRPADLLRALLREVLRRHDTFTLSGEVSDDLAPVEGLASSEPRTDTTAKPMSPLKAAFARLPLGQPLADTMTPEEIAAALARGDDPYAADMMGNDTPVQALPVRDLRAACALVQAFGTTAELEALTAPGAVTLITLPLRADRDTLYAALADILPSYLRLAGVPGDAEAKLTLFRPEEEGETVPAKRKLDRPWSGQTARPGDKLDEEISHGRPILLIAAGRDDLSVSARAVLTRELAWSATTADDVVESLRATHSVTGQLAEVAIRAALPAPEALAALPAPLWQRALSDASPLRAARSLAAFYDALPRPTGPTLDDLCGQPRVHALLGGLVDDLDAWRTGTLPWGEMASSALLCGPPGTGKTLAAGALAGSAGAHLVATSYADCQRAGHLGDYLAAMADRVEEAIANVPSIFFIDEIDSFATRDGSSGTNSRYMNSVVNGLLEHLSRLHATPGVLVIAATNHPSRIDPAITRAGRFDRHVHLTHPDRAGIDAILRGHLGPRLGSLDPGLVVDRLVGTSGAEIAATARMALGYARRQGRALTLDDLWDAAGEVAPAQSASDLHAIAVHEAGHIVAAAHLGLALPGSARITPRGGEVEVGTPARVTRRTAEARLAALMAGRAAERLLLDDVGNGAGIGRGSDLDVATGLALRLETEWGLGDHPPLHTPVDRERRLLMPAWLRSRVEEHLVLAETRATEIVEEYRAQVEHIATVLLAERELDGGQLADLTGPCRPGGQRRFLTSNMLH
jgi:cell division protease FtsH